jgi:hypothetical protein
VSEQPVAEEISIDLALTRVLTQLSAYLPTELAVVSLVGLPLPAPDSSAYFYGIGERAIDVLFANSSVAVLVFQDAPSTIEMEASNTPALYVMEQNASISVVVAFKMTQYTPFARFGKTVTDSDIMAMRAARYNAAVSRVMRTRIMGDAGIINVNKTNDAFGDYDTESDVVASNAFSTWEITQAVLVPVGCEEV